MITGDTILGRGTTVIAEPDGSLEHYLASLRRLQGFPGAVVLPGHGPMLGDLRDVAEIYLEHRRSRLRQVAEALVTLGAPPARDDRTIDDVVDLVYTNSPAAVRAAARASVRAQLLYIDRQTGDLD